MSFSACKTWSFCIPYVNLTAVVLSYGTRAALLDIRDQNPHRRPCKPNQVLSQWSVQQFWPYFKRRKWIFIKCGDWLMDFLICLSLILAFYLTFKWKFPYSTYSKFKMRNKRSLFLVTRLGGVTRLSRLGNPVSRGDNLPCKRVV